MTIRPLLTAGAITLTASVSASPQVPARPQGTAPAQSMGPQRGQDNVPQADANCPGHPDALGTSRILPVDPAQYPRVGHMQYPASLPLNDKEVVLTFDDGPLPPYSNEILDILASQCVKVTYFMVGEMARAYPAVVRRAYEEGHTIGTHSEDHPTRFGQLPVEKMRHEIDWGMSDVSAALGDPKYLAPFFRIPGLARSDLVESELAARGLIVFSSDTVADDWHRHIKPNQIIALAMRRLEALGKGILLLHDIHPTTVAALPGLLQQLKNSGFHIVQVVPAASYEIAMAKKPEAPMPASELRGDETLIGNGMDHKTLASWPQTSANNAADDSTLPVPDPLTFEPDALPSQDTADDSPRSGTRGRKSRERTWQRHQDGPLGKHTKEAYTCTCRRTAEITPTKSLTPQTMATTTNGVCRGANPAPTHVHGRICPRVHHNYYHRCRESFLPQRAATAEGSHSGVDAGNTASSSGCECS
jgi:peptidoglycan/xylan/chitin deacetylase (PgdA/CDA1 family)